MQTLMWALNAAYDREETRGFVKRRLTGARDGRPAPRSPSCSRSGCSSSARISRAGSAPPSALEALVAVALVDGAVADPDSRALLAVSRPVLYLGPNVDHPRWSFLTLGTVTSCVVWLARLRSVRGLRRAKLGRTTRPGDRSLCGDHHAHLALDQRPRAPLRRRGQRRVGAEPGAAARRSRGVDGTAGATEGLVHVEGIVPLYGRRHWILPSYFSVFGSDSALGAADAGPVLSLDRIAFIRLSGQLRVQDVLPARPFDRDEEALHETMISSARALSES